MRIKFNRTGTERKALVNTVSEITGARAVYKYMPTCAYEVDYFTIDREGTLIFDDTADSEEVENLLEQLEKRGFIAEEQKIENVGFTVSVPIENVNLTNLKNLLSAKGKLIKKALGIDELPIETNDESISFPWFSKMPDFDSVQAYSKLILLLCKMSKEQKRISPNETQTDNEKYAFRTFLLRLGFIGKEYKADRKILLKNLTGSSAFRNGGNHEITE
ncbi:MAG: virulence protein [Eubacterium sp.]|nr:virulence protein [Eubacterium sp.]